MMTVKKSHQKLPSSWADRELLRKKGQFWTPTWVAEAMVTYLTDCSDLIFDPATGRGAFYSALLKQNRQDIRFWGIDIDEDVITDPIYKNGDCFVEKRDFIRNPPECRFNAIVANPPYIRHHRIDDETKLFLKQLSSSIIGNTIDGRAGYHIYFLIQALHLLEKGGKLAFIMPADTCEGKFASNLWRWISEKFCIECVITFNELATPFPNVDTNAVVFLIRNSKPQNTFHWVKVKKAYTQDLTEFLASKFKKKNYETLEIVERLLDEGITTGFSRPKQDNLDTKFRLIDFAKVIRGIATGSNEYFFLTGQQVKNFNIPAKYLKRAIGRTKDVEKSILTLEDIERLDKVNRPTYLLSIIENGVYPKSVHDYLKYGEEMGLPARSLIRQRKPWYKMEKREIPPLLFTYLGRRSSRFIKNEASVVPLTGFLCVYPKYRNNEYIENLWQALNHADTLDNLKFVGKSYGSGAIKVEPSSLNRLSIPTHIVEKYNLEFQLKTFN